LQLAPQNFTNINIIFNIRLSIALFWMSAWIPAFSIS
jgi:hypothetical protein